MSWFQSSLQLRNMKGNLYITVKNNNSNMIVNKILSKYHKSQSFLKDSTNFSRSKR